MKNLILSICSIFLVSACSSAPAGKSKTSATVPSASLDTSDVRYQTTRDKKLNSNLCPTSSKSWQKENLSALADKANSCISIKNWKMLSALGDHLATVKPNLPWGAYYLSVASFGIGDNDRALWMIELALKKSPRLGFLHYQQGLVLWSMGEGLSAIRSMDTSLKYDSKLAESHLFLAQVQHRDGDLKSAEAHYKDLLKLEENNLTALVGIADIKYSQKNWRNATEFLSKAVDAAPMRVELKVRLAELYEMQKDYALALSVYKRINDLTSGGHKQKLNFDITDKIKSLEPIVAKERDANKVSQREEE